MDSSIHQPQTADHGDKQFQLAISGMSCASCVARLEKALRAVPGVIAASVNLATESANVTSDATTTLGSLQQAIERAGYGVPNEEYTLAISGLTCASCVAHVEKALAKTPGVSSVVVNLATEQARVRVVSGTPVETLEAAFPELTIAFQPFVGFGEWLGVEAARTALRGAAARYQSGALQDFEMFGDGGHTHLEWLSQVRNRRLA